MKRIRITVLALVIALIGILAGNDFAYAQKNGKQERRAQEREQNKAEKRERRETEHKRDEGRDNVRQRDQNRDRDRAQQLERGQNRDRSQGRARQEQGQRRNDQARERARQQQQHRDNDRYRNYRDHHSAPDIRPEHRRGYDHWRHQRRRYQPPRYGYHPPIHHGRHYRHRHYDHDYNWPSIIIRATIPIFIWNHPNYRHCSWVDRYVWNPSDCDARITINHYPYTFPSGLDYLRPGESTWIKVPVGPDYDVDAFVYVYDDWYEADLRSGRGSDLVILRPF